MSFSYPLAEKAAGGSAAASSANGYTKYISFPSISSSGLPVLVCAGLSGSNAGRSLNRCYRAAFTG